MIKRSRSHEDGMRNRDEYFTVREEVDVTIVELTRDVGDILTAEGLTRELAAFVNEVGQVDLVVDLKHVESCPSAIIAALITAQRRLEELGGRMKLAIYSARTWGVFQRLNMNMLFDIYHDRDDAVHAFRKQKDSR